jgi:hypothetical protein
MMRSSVYSFQAKSGSNYLEDNYELPEWIDIIYAIHRTKSKMMINNNGSKRTKNGES